MTQEQFRFIVEIGKEFEFSINGKKYLISYTKAHDGKKLIHISEDFIPYSTFESLTQMLAEAKIQNSFFKEVLNEL